RRSARTAIYTLSLPDALPIFSPGTWSRSSAVRMRSVGPPSPKVPRSISIHIALRPPGCHDMGETYTHDGSPLLSGTPWYPGSPTDRKSTRLNSSHDQISYAVF